MIFDTYRDFKLSHRSPNLLPHLLPPWFLPTRVMIQLGQKTYWTLNQYIRQKTV